MRPYRSLLLLLALATLGALAWHGLADDPGYLLLTFRGWSVETTLVVAVLALAIALLGLGFLISVLRVPWRLWRRRRRIAARERLGQGLLALHRGQYLQAEKLLRRAARDPVLRLPALLQAAQAADARGDQAGADALRAEAGAASGLDAALPEIERLLQQDRAGIACERLEHLRQSGELPPRALELLARAQAAAGRADQALPLLAALRRSHGRDNDRVAALERMLLQQTLQQATSTAELEQRWQALERGQRAEPALVEAYAERALRLGEREAAAEAIERTLARQWSGPLARLYGRAAGDRQQALKIAERWLEQHPGNADVLLCLGRLCRREQLWGKAEAYLQRALAEGAGSEGWETLAEVCLDQGDDGRARQAFANALAASRGEPVRPLLKHERTTPEAVEREERSSMGLPQLPAAR